MQGGRTGGLDRFPTAICGLGAGRGESAKGAWSSKDAPFGSGRGDRGWPDDSAVASAVGGI